MRDPDNNQNTTAEYTISTARELGVIIKKIMKIEQPQEANLAEIVRPRAEHDKFARGIIHFANLSDVPINSDIGRYLLALAKDKVETKDRSIFAGRDLCYCHNETTIKKPSEPHDLWYAVELIFTPTRNPHFKDASSYRYSDLMLKLRGDTNFVRDFYTILRNFSFEAIQELFISKTYSSYDEDLYLHLLEGRKNIIRKEDFDIHPKQFFHVIRSVLFHGMKKASDVFFDLANKISNISVPHSKERYKDWVRELTAIGKFASGSLNMPNGWRNSLRFAGFDDYQEDIPASWYVGTECSYFPFNLIDDESNLTCVLGPKGLNKKVALLYELDPYMGILRLIPCDLKDEKKFSIEDHKNAIGLASIVQCYDESRDMVWLVDAVDAGLVTRFCTANWAEEFYNGIIAAATDPLLSKKPNRICFNQNVTNPSSKEFNAYIREKGSRRGRILDKIGGKKAIRNIGRRKEHYLEAYHYKTGSVWYPGGPFLADVVEVEL